jgi:8-oxo-dGTP pyrophosphatase MutT (NUDIX family)
MPENPVVARPASSVLIVRPRDGIEVLMVERPARGFFGGLMVFPGGAVDPYDAGFGGGRLDGRFRVAGLRETAEEVGIVITESGFAPAPGLRGKALLDELSQRPDGVGLDRMTLISRWITPELAPKRFDTHFYIVEIDGDPEIRIDKSELVGSSWVSPDAALERHASGEWSMILPTISHLRWLERFDSISSALRAAAGADGFTVIEPVERDQELLVRYRGADEY